MTFTADDWVDAQFPTDGPHSPDQVVAAAEAVAHLVLYLNHATQRPELEGPDLHRVLAAVADAGQQLPQLVQQLGHTAERLTDDPTLYDDRGGPGAGTALEVAVALGEGVVDATRLGRALDQATQAASHLGHGVGGR